MGFVVGCSEPPDGSTLTATAAIVAAATGSCMTVVPEAGMNVTDGAIFFAPAESVHAWYVRPLGNDGKSRMAR